MKKNDMHRVFAGLLAMALVVCATVIGWTAAAPEQTTAKPTTTAEPLVINTVENQDDIVLTVVRGDETVFQYSGDIELWKGEDGKAYGIIYLDEEVLQ